MRNFARALIIFFLSIGSLYSQVNTDKVLMFGRNALYFEDYILSIQYFNEVIKVKPFLADPYFYRSVAKINLDDFQGALDDADECIRINPFMVNAYQIRGIANQNLERYIDAIEDYEAGLRLSPENRTFLINRAIAYAQIKDYDKSKEAFEVLVDIHPNNYNAYISRSALFLETGDSISALKDLDKAISIDKYSSYAYAQRAVVKSRMSEFKSALEDMDYAIRLDPDYANFYTNRALIKYHLEDLRGAMADYDRVIDMDKNNHIAYYNRGLLRAYVGDRNNAIDDFSNVIVLEPDNFHAYYNRAIIRDEIGDYNGAIADYTMVLKEYPRFLPGWYARSESKRKMNDLKGGEADFNKAYALEKELLAERDGKKKKEDNKNSSKETRSESDKNIEKFNRVIVADNSNVKTKYNSEIRGRVQDRNVNVELEDSYRLTYYENDDHIRKNIYYSAILNDFNKANVLNKQLKVVNSEVSLDEDRIRTHFSSINYYSRELEVSSNNALAYFARSIDFLLVQDFQGAIEDLNKVILLQSDFSLAYFNRAVVRLKQIETDAMNNNDVGLDDSSLKLNIINTGSFNLKKNNHVASGSVSRVNDNFNDKKRIDFEMVMRDYDKAIDLDPSFVYAYFNRANLSCMQRHYDQALIDYNKALELNPVFAEALFNRGLVHIYKGNTDKGIADLSKAGELGIIKSYNIIKRMGQ